MKRPDQQRLDIGLSTNVLVIQAQRDRPRGNAPGGLKPYGFWGFGVGSGTRS
jgi:hypothetical protein